MSSSIKEKAGKKERDDVLLILDENGKVLHQQTGSWLLRQIGHRPINLRIKHPIGEEKADYDLTHFNSIYEIPENAGAAHASYLKPGNIIVNSSGVGIFILSPDLKRVLYHVKIKDNEDVLLHDVQVTLEGEFIYFNNVIADPESPNRYSAIDKYNPITKKRTFRFTAEPKGMFYATTSGGVQEFGDFIFFSHIVTGGYLYSKTKKTIVLTVPPSFSSPLRPVPVQQIKILDVRKFLENHGK
jgi:hypothetical protein